MRRSIAGFTLLEVSVALLLISVGLLGLLGTLGPAAVLAGSGRARGRSAMVLESRLDRLRNAVARGAPACVVPPGGTQRHPDGVVERWSAAAGAGHLAVQVQAGIPGRGAPDTLATLLPCP